MHKGRLEAFSDGVLAIIITIMVLELRPPRDSTLASLRPMLPALCGYAVSFIYVGIYWNNHHHLFQAVHRVNGATLWANLHLLFWLSLVPFVTSWMGETHYAASPAAAYGVVLLMAGISFTILVRVLVRSHGRESTLARAMGADRKGKASLVLYAAGIGLSFARPWVACAVYTLVALMWLIPDPRIERRMEHAAEHCDQPTPGVS
jgi:uncharacterized membrane protein